MDDVRQGPSQIFSSLALITVLCLSVSAAAQEESGDDPIVDAVDLALGGEEPGELPGEPGLAPDEPGQPPAEEPQERFVPRSGNEPDPRALEMYAYAEEAYAQGRYQEAVGFLEEALTYDPNAADLQYNMALVLERLGEFDEALRYLELYRQHQLDDEEQTRVDRMIVRIRGAAANAPVAPVPEVRTRVVTRRFGRADGWFWGMVGATVLFAGGAVATGALALDWNAAAEGFRLGANGDINEYRYFADTASTLALLTDIGIGLASATALTALLLYVLRSSQVEEAVTADEPAEDGEPAAAEDVVNPTESASRLRRALVPMVSAGPTGFLMSWDI